MILGISAIIATANRSRIFQRTIESVAAQSHFPKEVIVIDASDDHSTKDVCESLPDLPFKLVHVRAIRKGAAQQRNQGIEMTNQSIIWFLDDDIILEPGCTERIWKGFDFLPNVGAVNAMITNQRYTSPGLVTRTMYKLMFGKTMSSYAGRIIGPAWNILPEDNDDLPQYNVCEWLNTTCTMYKRDVLPHPVFSSYFTGYSLMEDVALSVTVGKAHTLLNARTARIYHDSQPGSHKSSIVKLSSMELVNRYYVTRHVLNRRANFKLLIFEMFGIISTLRTGAGWKSFPQLTIGKLLGLLMIFNIIKRNF